MTLRIHLVTILAILLFAGCAAPPQLTQKGRIAPADVDFSGLWLLRGERGPSSGARPAGDPEASQPIDERVRRRPSRRTSDSTVHLFLETGRLLKITQTLHGFFVSVDRAIVEEFSFGENRTISVGPIEAQRVSGWEGSRYVVETLDDEGAILREVWQLDDSGDVLIRDIAITERDKERFTLKQRFDRQ